MHSPTVSQNDPAELLDVLNARGQPTGHALTRAEIHVQGRWHRAFHCWIVRHPPTGLQIVLQRRSAEKDTFPGCWDASAAGHWRRGETAEEAAREIEEELGIAIPFSRLRYVGRERSTRRHPNSLIDFEHHEVYFARWDRPLDTYRPDPAEVQGLATVDARALLRLMSGAVSSLPAAESVHVMPDGTVSPDAAVLVRPDLVPYSRARLRRLIAACGGFGV